MPPCSPFGLPDRSKSRAPEFSGNPQIRILPLFGAIGRGQLPAFSQVLRREHVFALQRNQFVTNPARFSRTMARSSADRKAERSFGVKGGGPPVTAPAERRSSIRLRVASVMPIESSVKLRPVGAST